MSKALKFVIIEQNSITTNLVWIMQKHTQTGLVVLEQECHQHHTCPTKWILQCVWRHEMSVQSLP
jgi:hypothetical protein